MKQIITLLIVAFSQHIPNVYSQTNAGQIDALPEISNPQLLITLCTESIMDGNYSYAHKITDELLKYDVESANYNYRKGFLLIRDNGDYTGATPYLEKAVLDVKSDYNMFSENEKSASIDALFYLAECYHRNDDFEKAISHYEKFIELSGSRSPLVEKANSAVEQCKSLGENKGSVEGIQLVNLGNNVNTKYNDFSPVISPDNKTLYFTSRQPINPEVKLQASQSKRVKETIFKINLQESEMQIIKLNEDDKGRNEAACAIDTEGKMYIYTDLTGNGDIYYYENPSSKIKKLNIRKVNTKYWETHGFLTSDQQAFYFVSNRPGGYGGRDIYVVRKNEKGQWGKPENLGSEINSKADEDAPFVSADNSKLYFSSNGKKSMGGFDIFVSELRPDHTWSEPKNLGKPYNSVYDELFYVRSTDNEREFLASDRRGGFGNMDIYEVKAIEVIEEPLLTDLESEETGLDTQSEFNFPSLDFKHFFTYNANKIKASEGKLNEFITLVEQQLTTGKANITIEIYSSASKVPTRTYKTNETLSEKRAENIKSELLQYFSQKEEWSERVTVVIVSTVVDGPDYNNDSQNRIKYEPFQFIVLKTR